ncbi:MAG: mechanosensitive ion channel family protein [Muribaculaceae bacterium]|nr:mechanosensitive ion channel family protein [Muribaculaceae bacterium]
MHKFSKIIALIFVVLLAVCVRLNAQTNNDTAHFESEPVLTASPADSSYVSMLQDSLRAAQINEANVRMELEQLRFEMASADSIQRSEQMHRIDSLRRFTPGIPVIVNSDTLFYFYSNRGGYTAQQRALLAVEAIELLGGKFNTMPDSVFIDNSDNISDIMYGKTVITSFTDRDAMWAGIPQDSLAQEVRAKIVWELTKLKEEHGLWQLVKRIFFLILIVVAQFFLIKLTNWLFRKLRQYIEQVRGTKLKPLMIQNYELLDTRKEVRLLLSFANILRYVVIILQLLISLPLIFVIFPQTESFAYTILGYIWYPVKAILKGIVEYVPNLFTIAIIWFAIRYLVKLIHYLSKEIESERLKINGFYPDWARPTYNIIRFLLYAFMVAMIYPYLPGSDTGVFQGISVFVGLIVSLGSSTVIGNIIAGMVITYMRPFHRGDRIKFNDTVGDIIEKTPLVTRLRTPKNEIVTVPNSFIMSSQSINYSTSARDYGLILHSEVTIGYDVPWRLVHKLLIEAALDTKGVLHDPKPFVLETGLNDWYPVYQINAYTREAQRMSAIYSELFQNIQDHFNEAGVEIMSPTYIATRDGNASTVVTNPNEGL